MALKLQPKIKVNKNYLLPKPEEAESQTPKIKITLHLVQMNFYKLKILQMKCCRDNSVCCKRATLTSAKKETKDL